MIADAVQVEFNLNINQLTGYTLYIPTREHNFKG